MHKFRAQTTHASSWAFAAPRFWLLVVALLALAAPAFADVQATNPELSQVQALVDSGHFAEAKAQVAKAVANEALSTDERDAFAFQVERMRRILLDFDVEEAELKARVLKQIPDMTDEEFGRWQSQGLFEKQVIDGRTLYFNRAASNLFRLSREALARRAVQTPLVDGPMERVHPHHREVRDAALAGGPAASRAIRVTQSLSVNADAVPAGEAVRAWIPYPREIAGQQQDIRLIESTPKASQVAPNSALQRTVYLEKPAEAGKPTEFSITYEMTVLGKYHPVDAAKVVPVAPTAELAPHLGERAPHIVFTEAMRSFSRRVVGDETNPYRIAQKLFAAVDEIPWAGAREYSTISNISDYALHAGHADCGQQTLLLMTLLRLNGIPARWQSGMIYSDGKYDNLHDWGWLYLAPYGWLPMDVTIGRLQDQDPQIAGFYLGGLDAYRIAFNDDYGQPFVPAKQHVRSETVDLQRGEAEWRGGNLYFDQWDYTFSGQVLPGNHDTPSQARTGERL